jgi:hypothetical protein
MTCDAGPVLTVVDAVAEVRPVDAAVSMYGFVLELVYEQLKKVATPLVTTVLVDKQLNPPLLVPLVPVSVTVDVLSVETTLLNWSSSVTLTVNFVPAVIVVGGGVE